MDGVTRALSQYLGEGRNQQFIVENRGCANASIGAEVVATSKPDGYTLLVVSGVPFVLNEAIYEDLAYDTQADFAPINVFAALPMVLVATALAVLQDGIEEFLQDQVELYGSRLAGWGHGVQARSELVHGDRDPAGERAGARGASGP